MNIPVRRGACPRLSSPMATGDGLLARLVPSGKTIVLDAFAELCSAARSHGNGIIEITSRGNIQVRGLSAASVVDFAARVEPLEIDCGDVIPVLTDPLAGLESGSAIDVGVLADSLRRSVGAASFASRLSAKISVIADGGGALCLDDVSADIRLRATDDPGGSFHVALGGNASSATQFGAVAADRAVECIVRLLKVLAGRAPQGRMRDVLNNDGLAAFAAAVVDLIAPMAPPKPRSARPIGAHRLLAGDVAIGVGLPFGHSDAETIVALIDTARRVGASGVRTAPGRALLVVGLSPPAAQELREQVVALGLIVDPDDPRRKVIACAGSPICASGQIPSRMLAPAVAQAMPPACSDIIHVSGCSKGCAHPAPTSIAVFGRDGVCDIRVDGRSSHSATIEDLPVQIAGILQSRRSLSVAKRQDYLRDGAEIYRRSFAIIRAEADLSRFSDDEAEVVVRMIHACGLPEAARLIEFSHGLVATARRALSDGAPILCDSEMVAHGITRARLPANNQVVCTLHDPRVPSLAEQRQTTRSAAALELWTDRLAGAVVAIGNAPTALFHLLEMLAQGAPRPAAIIGIPVGFVGAVESKAALAGDPSGVPFLTVRDRIGGSAMTAAAINALARAER